MPKQKPQVSVFHFTQNISSAKMRKYQLATERGMAPANTGTPATNNTPQTVPTPAAPNPPAAISNPSVAAPPASLPAASPPTSAPPAKKPRLDLQVPPNGGQSSATATLRASDKAVPLSKPNVRSKVNVRLTAEMDVVPTNPPRDVPRATSSNLSSLSSTPPVDSVETPKPAKEPTRVSKEYGDFMSYYVAGGDDDEDDQPPAEAMESSTNPATQPAQPSAPGSIHHQKQQSQPLLPSPQQPRRSIAQSSVARPSQTQAVGRRRSQQLQGQPFRGQQVQAPPPPIHIPEIELVGLDIEFNPDEPREPDTVEVMVRKLDKLSTALSAFGGLPTVPSTPQITNGEERVKSKESGQENPLDGFLGMFEGDDSDDDNDDGKRVVKKHPLDYKLSTVGSVDAPLTFGIQFIQSALMSWAQKRLQHQFNFQFAEVTKRQQAAIAAQTQHRRLGPPHQSQGGHDVAASAALPIAVPVAPPAKIQMSLAGQPEGIAIKAFYDVLKSGALQINTAIPRELAQGLRQLYMQIDHLINQGAQPKSQWQCMSYGAQIAANKHRVDQWKEAQTRAHEEMTRQHLGNHDHAVQHIGVQAQQSSTVQVQQPSNQPTAPGRKMSSLNATAPPSTAQDASRSPGLSARFNSSPPIVDNLSTHADITDVPFPYSAANTNRPPSHSPGESSAGSGAGGELGKVKMYVPGYLPRSGTQMKFSFAPDNPEAVKVFGPEAFPSGSPGPRIPNRGPMSMSSESPPSSHAFKDSVRPPVVGAAKEAPQEDVAANETHDRAADTAGSKVNDDEIVVAHPGKHRSLTGFTAVNGQSTSRPASVPSFSRASPSANGIEAPRKPTGSGVTSASLSLGGNASNKARNRGQRGTSELANGLGQPEAMVID